MFIEEKFPMANENDNSAEEFYNQMKSSLRESFARIYAALKARELRTARQLQAIKTQCESSHNHSSACLRSLKISYDSEHTILSNVAHFGEVQLDSLNLNGTTFKIEDYISPEEDHMYNYKDIDKIITETERLDIQEAALRQIVNTEGCVCSVKLTTEIITKTFCQDIPKPTALPHCCQMEPPCSDAQNSKECPVVTNNECTLQNGFSSEYSRHTEKIIEIPKNECHICNKEEKTEKTSVIPQSDEKCQSNEDKCKIDPTEEWLDCIKGHIETEPTQVSDVMEHSKIRL